MAGYPSAGTVVVSAAHAGRSECLGGPSSLSTNTAASWTAGEMVSVSGWRATAGPASRIRSSGQNSNPPQTVA